MSENVEVEKPKHVVEKEKNPKRVAAGKALAEKNRKCTEHFEKTAGVKTEVEPAPAPESSNTSTYFIAGVVILGVVEFAYYQSQQKPVVEKSKPVVVEKPAPNRLITV